MTLYGYARVSVREPEDKNLDLTVHPHPRGESATRIVKDAAVKGSPPPAWGKRAPDPFPDLHPGFTPTRVGKAVDRLRVGRVKRFTPTRVGKAPLPTPAAGIRRVHPHPRGESGYGAGMTLRDYGSPPPAWGKR